MFTYENIWSYLIHTEKWSGLSAVCVTKEFGEAIGVPTKKRSCKRECLPTSRSEWLHDLRQTLYNCPSMPLPPAQASKGTLHERNLCTLRILISNVPGAKFTIEKQARQKGHLVRRYWLGPSDEYHSTCCCIPLALGSGLIALVFTVWGIMNVCSAIIYGSGLTWEDTGDIFVGTFKAVVGLLGLAGLILRWQRGLYCLVVGYNVFLVSSFVSCVLKWLEWSMAIGGNHSLRDDGSRWSPTRQDRLFMIFFTVEHFLIYCMSFFCIIGVLRSTRIVIAHEGTGFELKNYQEILETKMTEAFTHEEKATEV